MKNAVVALIAALMLASVFMTGAVCARAEEPAAVSFSIDRRAEVVLASGETTYIRFTPAVTDTYDVFVYPGTGTVDDIAILLDEQEIAHGTGAGHAFSAQITADAEYVLAVGGEGEILIELMRHAEGRSILMPAQLPEDGGLIVRPGSVMWYGVETGGMYAGIYVLPKGGRGAELDARLYTKDGVLAAEPEQMTGGACVLYPEPSEEEYLLRVCAPDGSTGGFDVKLALSEDMGPFSVELVSDSMTMRKGDVRSVRARTRPLDMASGIMWFSSDASVAEVSSTGVITAVGVGEAVISAYAMGGMYATINVTVEPVEPQYIAYRGESISVRVGDVLTPVKLVYPAAAAEDERIVYESSDTETVSISENGEITALREGSAVIAASYGGLRAELTVYVDEAPTRYRALLVSVQNYAADVNTGREGAVNTVYNLESLLNTASYAGEKCAVTVEADLTAGETLSAIEKAFAGAQEKDISILYISCHGYFRDGMTLLQFRDGSELAACDLETALRKVPGTIVILADFCDSGGLIHGYETTAQLAGGMVSAFAGEPAAFGSGKYKVLASAALGQDSYRLGTAGDEDNAVTVFARALCDALGWDIEDQRRGPLNADNNFDGQITLWEAYLYADRRVQWYLSRAGGGYRQDVQIYPEGDMFVLFERE